MSRADPKRPRSAEKPREEPAQEQPIRQRILSAAFAAFTEHGFAQASTLEIATRAKVSKRELYSLFGNKQQVLVSCISERAKRMRLPAGWPTPRNPEELEAGLVKFASVMLQEVSDPDVIAVYRLAVGEADRSPEVAQALDKYGRQASRAALREILEGARSAGLLARIDLDRMVDRFMALLLGDVVMSMALGLRKRPGTEEIVQRAQDATRDLLDSQLEPGAKRDRTTRVERRPKAA